MLAKIVYLLWARRGQHRDLTRQLLLEQGAPRLLDCGARQLFMNIADPESAVRSPAPRLTRELPLDAQVSLWAEASQDHTCFEECLAGLGFRAAGYLVEETVYTDYGENSHAAPRSWPDGQRSPGLITVNLLERPGRLSQEEWMRRWHGSMSPLSEIIQPRSRYVRNQVLEVLSADAPALAAIVEEAWPSPQHVSNPFLFFGARHFWELPRNLLRILRATLAFAELHRIRTTPMGEYFLKTDPLVPRLRRSSYDRYC